MIFPEGTPEVGRVMIHKFFAPLLLEEEADFVEEILKWAEFNESYDSEVMIFEGWKVEFLKFFGVFIKYDISLIYLTRGDAASWANLVGVMIHNFFEERRLIFSRTRRKLKWAEVNEIYVYKHFLIWRGALICLTTRSNNLFIQSRIFLVRENVGS